MADDAYRVARLNIAVLGVNFVNKGSELMLRAIMQQVRSWPENPVVALPLHSGSASQRVGVGAHHLLIPMFYRFAALDELAIPVGNALPRAVARRFDSLRTSDVHLVLDASGFAYSDQWGARRVHRYGRLYERFAAQGTRVVLLPQALGPFASDEIRRAFRDLVANSAIVFARDTESMGHARRAAPNAVNINTAPDFTVLVSGKGAPGDSTYTGRACVVPNARMLDKTSADVGAWYIHTLAYGIRRLQELQLDPFLLLMQDSDRSVVRQLGDGGLQAEVVWEPDPLRLKAVIAAASVVMGSRYHGLVSALSQETPVVGVGWSHKYEQLFEEYGCPEMLLEHLATSEALDLRLERLADTVEREKLVERTRPRAGEVRARALQMWSQVRELMVENPNVSSPSMRART